MTNIAELKIDTGKCTGCGLCVKVCPGSIISIGGADKATHGDITEFGWDGCWKCMHCLAVCPQGAISVLGRRPQDSPSLPGSASAAAVDSVISFRRSHRRYVRKNVDKALISHMLGLLRNAPQRREQGAGPIYADRRCGTDGSLQRNGPRTDGRAGLERRVRERL